MKWSPPGLVTWLESRRWNRAGKCREQALVTWAMQAARRLTWVLPTAYLGWKVEKNQAYFIAVRGSRGSEGCWGNGLVNKVFAILFSPPRMYVLLSRCSSVSL